MHWSGSWRIVMLQLLLLLSLMHRKDSVARTRLLQLPFEKRLVVLGNFRTEGIEHKSNARRTPLHYGQGNGEVAGARDSRIPQLNRLMREWI